MAELFANKSIGNDNSNGSLHAPFRTEDKIFQVAKPDDKLYFNGGDSFMGGHVLNKSGLHIDSYGTGLATFDGSFYLSGWKNEGAGIWSVTDPRIADDLNLVRLNGHIAAKGRYPKKSAPNGGYITATSVSGSSIAHSDIRPFPDLTGADIVMKTVPYQIERGKILSKKEDVVFLSKSGGYAFKAKHGFFFQNHPSCCTEIGEWSVSGKTFRMFFGNQDPLKFAVQVASVPHIFKLGNRPTGIQVKNLKIQGSNSDAFDALYGYSLQLEGLDFSYCGGDAVFAKDHTGIRMKKSKINWMLNSGFYMDYFTPDSRIDDTEVENIGLLEGHISPGRMGGGTGICIPWTGSHAENNKIKKTGYNGLKFEKSDTKVIGNEASQVCEIMEDGGCFYSWNAGSNPPQKGMVFSKNWGHSSGGKGHFGSIYGKSFQVEGLYLDDLVSGILVEDNVMEGLTGAAYYLHNTSAVNMRRNTGFNCETILKIKGDQPSMLEQHRIRKMVLQNNTFVAKTTDQKVLFLYTGVDEGHKMSTPTEWDTNIMCRPIDEGKTIFREVGKSKFSHTFQEWQAVHGYDRNSRKSPRLITDPNSIQLFTNHSKQPKSFLLQGQYIDLSNKAEGPTLTLAPYQSKILIQTSGTPPVKPEEPIIPTPEPMEPIKESPTHLINCGSSKEAVYKGDTYKADVNTPAYYNPESRAGNEFPESSAEPLFQTERHGATVECKIPVPPGKYTLTTHHNEVYWGKADPANGGPGKREFELSINGKQEIPKIDLFEHGSKDTSFTFDGVEPKDGFITLTLKASVNNATLAGIKVVPMEETPQEEEEKETTVQITVKVKGTNVTVTHQTL